MRYWKRIDKDGKTTTVESYSHSLKIDGAIGIDEDEFNAYLSSLPVPKPVIVRDLVAEIDSLESRIEKLEVPDV